jgi:AcrR family transcriptional regulator
VTVEDARLAVQRDPAATVSALAGASAADASELAGETPTPRQPLPSGPGAKVRILATATRLFYFEGIRAVGIDRLISESSVTKATFYKHFGSKDALIIAYITAVHEESVELVNGIEAASAEPRDALKHLVAHLQQQLQSDDFRGCAFINAAVEFSDPAHPVRQLVMAHRDWYTAVIAELFRESGHELPGDAADEFLVLRDGAMMGAYVGDAIATTTAMTRLSERALQGIAA